MKDKLKHLPVLILAFITIWLRLVNLGYSDYEPDEIKALYLPASGQSMVSFLIQQRKGPVQFLVTFLARFFTPTYSNTFITRLPFALAGILAVFVFYKLLQLHFGRKVALYASLLLATNGLFIGLTRVVQYQPFVMLFSIYALYAFSLALIDRRWKITGIYAGMLSWGASLMTHYDGVFIAPFALYLLYRWYMQNADLAPSTRLKHLALPVAICAILLSSFYIPMLTSLSDVTLNYWRYRFTDVSETLKPSSSIFTFRLYNPLLVIYLYIVLGLLSAWKIKQNWPILFWFLIPWIALEVVIKEPGTHIYAYLIPAVILVAFGLVVIEEALVRSLSKVVHNQASRMLTAVFLVGFFGFLFSLSHLIYVDHTPEYPWQARRFLVWKIGGLKDPPNNVWPYGFPYNRHWGEIREYVMSHDPNGYYSTNEDKSISFFYIPQQNDVERSGYYIHIYNPQDLKESISKEKVRYWMKHYPPVKVFTNGGVVISEIYLMPSGDLTEIRSKGY